MGGIVDDDHGIYLSPRCLRMLSSRALTFAGLSWVGTTIRDLSFLHHQRSHAEPAANNSNPGRRHRMPQRKTDFLIEVRTFGSRRPASPSGL